MLPSTSPRRGMMNVNVKELLKKRQAEVALREVRFTANIGRYVVQSSKTEYDNFGNKHNTGGIMFDMDFGGQTAPLDPADPAHADLIEAGRAEINDPRMAKKVARYRFREVAADAVTIPFDSWNETKASRIGELVSELGTNLEAAILYEEQKGDEARDDVIAVLMDVRENGSQEKAADTAEPMIGD